MPHSPVWSGIAPKDVTASTTVIAPLRAAIAAIVSTGFNTPVDVSAWTTATMSAGADASARSTAAGSQARPHSTSRRATSAP